MWGVACKKQDCNLDNYRNQLNILDDPAFAIKQAFVDIFLSVKTGSKVQLTFFINDKIVFTTLTKKDKKIGQETIRIFPPKILLLGPAVKVMVNQRETRPKFFFSFHFY